jgi:hypothetical protein
VSLRGVACIGLRNSFLKVFLDLLGFGGGYELIILSLENSGIIYRFKKFIFRVERSA